MATHTTCGVAVTVVTSIVWNTLTEYNDVSAQPSYFRLVSFSCDTVFLELLS